MFREKALVKLKSPEQLDEPLRVIPRFSRIAGVALMIVAGFSILWGSFGAIPESGRGQGILITPNTVVPIQAQAAGQVSRWFVKVGETVEKDQIIAILEQQEIQQESDHAIARLEEIRQRNQTVSELRKRYWDLEKEAIAGKAESLTERIEYLRDFIDRTVKIAEDVNANNISLLRIQKENLEVSRESARRLTAELKQRLESYQRLREENLASDDSVKDIARQYDDGVLNLRDLDLQFEQMDLRQVELNESYLNTRNQITTRQNLLADLEIQRQELENRAANLEKVNNEAEFRERNEFKELERTIERNQRRLSLNREVKADRSGRILELTATEGAFVDQGQRLAQMDIRTDSDRLTALAYFQSKDGKQIEEGEFVRVSPDTVSQKQYGSIVGKVVSVSEFPVTTEAIANYIGNTAVAEKLTNGGYEIELFIELQTNEDNFTGFEWTSARGPEVAITAGTTADITTTLEYRPPISYVIPVIRKWTGL